MDENISRSSDTDSTTTANDSSDNLVTGTIDINQLSSTVVKNNLDNFSNQTYSLGENHRTSDSTSTVMKNDGRQPLMDKTKHFINISTTDINHSKKRKLSSSSDISSSYSEPFRRRRKRLITGARDKYNDPNNSSAHEIWSEDVHEAFKEALSIIPKDGLHKIKIDGRACGRNELISDYICTKTNQIRTKKQVSSHIQAIKNLNKDFETIELIINGPPKTEEVQKSFEQIFIQISRTKSTDDGNIEVNDENSLISDNHKLIEDEVKLSNPYNVLKNKVELCRQLREININLKKFRMNYININDPPQSHNFTNLPEYNSMQQSLRIRQNAKLSNRFPKFFELIEEIRDSLEYKNYRPTSLEDETIPPIPLLHGMVKMTTPPLNNDLNSGHYNVGATIQLLHLPFADENYCSLTLIYSFGRLIVTTFEKLEPRITKKNDKKDATFEIRIGTNYWKDFFNGFKKLLGDNKNGIDEDHLLSKAIKSITMKQVIFNASNEELKKLMPNNGEPYSIRCNLDNIKKYNIRCILLWEFLRVSLNEDAFTTMRKIHLPLIEEEEQQQHQHNHVLSPQKQSIPPPLQLQVTTQIQPQRQSQPSAYSNDIPDMSILLPQSATTGAMDYDDSIQDFNITSFTPRRDSPDVIFSNKSTPILKLSDIQPMQTQHNSLSLSAFTSPTVGGHYHNDQLDILDILDQTGNSTLINSTHKSNFDDHINLNQTHLSLSHEDTTLFNMTSSPLLNKVKHHYHHHQNKSNNHDHDQNQKDENENDHLNEFDEELPFFTLNPILDVPDHIHQNENIHNTSINHHTKGRVGLTTGMVNEFIGLGAESGNWDVFGLDEKKI